MRTLIRLLAGVTARFPWAVLAVTLALTVVLAGLASTLESASGQDGFSPESEEIAASERISELFGDGSTTSVLQVLVADEGGDVLTREALQVIDDLEAAITASDAGDALASGPGQPALLSYLAPVQQSLAAQEIGRAHV